MKGDLIRTPAFPETIKTSYEFFYRLKETDLPLSFLTLLFLKALTFSSRYLLNFPNINSKLQFKIFIKILYHMTQYWKKM